VFRVWTGWESRCLFANSWFEYQRVDTILPRNSNRIKHSDAIFEDSGGAHPLDGKAAD
jgi:hypothetical protein